MVAGVVRRLSRFDALALAAGIWFLGKFVRYAFPPLFETLGSTYGVSRTVLGTAFTGFMLVYAAMQFPSGLVADRIGSVRVIAAGTLVTAVGSLALVVDAPFWVLAGAMLVMGAGTGVHKTVAVEFLSRAYPARTGRALGAFDTVGALAGAAAPATVVLVSGLPAVVGAPWRTVFLAAGLAGVALTAAFVLRVPDRPRGRSGTPAERSGTPAGGASGRSIDSPVDDGAGGSTRHGTTEDRATGGEAIDDRPTDDRSTDDRPTDDRPADDQAAGGGATDDRPTDDEPSASLGTYLGLFRRWRFTAFVGVTFLFSFGYNGAVAFLPLYLTNETALSTVTANLLFSALFVVSLVQLVTGEASDRAGPLPVIAVTVGIATAGLAGILALSATGGPLVLGAAVVALGIGAHGYRPVRGVYLMSVVPEGVAGGALGVVRTLLMIGGAVSPAIVGFASETAGFGAAFGILVAALAGATALTLVLWSLER